MPDRCRLHPDVRQITYCPACRGGKGGLATSDEKRAASRRNLTRGGAAMKRMEVAVLNRGTGLWESIGAGRTVAGVIHRRYGRRYTYQPDSGVPGYGLLLAPCSTGGWTVEARIRWSPVVEREVTPASTTPAPS